ncbi:MAG: nucleotidyltransferase family protein [Methylococcaceae bacterium]
MRAMILAAGRGERMRHLTNNTPKPLLKAGRKSLIERTIEQLVAANFTEIVINHAYLGEQIEATLGNGSQFGATIVYSPEGKNGLETAGGIIHALPLLGDKPFLVVNGDIATDFPFETLQKQPVDLAHLVLVANPEHHLSGDFQLRSDGRIKAHPPCPPLKGGMLTFSGIGIYSPEFFKNAPQNSTKLAPLLRAAMLKNRVKGQFFDGFWLDIGTPERLQILENRLAPTLI